MKIGTRKSRLAVIQAELVMSAIREHFPMLDVELTGLDTKEIGRASCRERV